jgi:hypothetical protein
MCSSQVVKNKRERQNAKISSGQNSPVGALQLNGVARFVYVKPTTPPEELGLIQKW